ncbi:hypothetical protein MK079_01425 [Candidatus Gracilibacteria bacterium]|nr:hypothetical protein [Candidatus Gracilibacteria bacterium]
MNIYYQGNPGSYMHGASEAIAPYLSNQSGDIIGKPDFSEVWESIGEEHIGVLAIENSYMGSIHPNIYGFLKYDYKIIGEYYGPIEHCLCSKETDISQITQAYSQIPALEQCHKYLQGKNIEPIVFSDTALSAKYLSENDIPGTAAICSVQAAKLYGLNILDTNIADQNGNTTRFALITGQENKIVYGKKSNKMSLIFTAKNIPSSLHKCLGVFAQKEINLTKIESLPSYGNAFEYMFWIDIEGNSQESNISEAVKSLEDFAKNIKIIGEY